MSSGQECTGFHSMLMASGKSVKILLTTMRLLRTTAIAEAFQFEWAAQFGNAMSIDVQMGPLRCLHAFCIDEKDQH